MTLKELSKLFYLNKEIELLEKEINDIKEQKKNDKTESIQQKVEHLTKIIIKKQVECIDERIKMENYIDEIKDSKVRLIARLRFIEFKSWYDIADLITPIEQELVDRTTPFKALKRYLVQND